VPSSIGPIFCRSVQHSPALVVAPALRRNRLTTIQTQLCAIASVCRLCRVLLVTVIV